MSEEPKPPRTRLLPTPATWVPAAYSLLLAALVLGPLLGSGYLLLRDAVSTPRSYLTDSALGLGDAAPRAVPQDALIATLSTVIDGGLLVKAILLSAIWLAGWGAAVLSRELLRAPLAPQLVAATLAIWNPYVAERLLQGHWSLLTGYAALPWIAVLATRLRITTTSKLGAGRVRTSTGLGKSARSAQDDPAPRTSTGTSGDTQDTTGSASHTASHGYSAERESATHRLTFTPTSTMRLGLTWAALGGCLAAAGLTPTGSLLAACTALLLVGRRNLLGTLALWIAASAPWLMATALSGAGAEPSDPAGVAAFAARAEPWLGTLGSLAGLGGIWNSTAVPESRTTFFAAIGTLLLLGLVATGIRTVIGRTLAPAALSPGCPSPGGEHGTRAGAFDAEGTEPSAAQAGEARTETASADRAGHSTHERPSADRAKHSAHPPSANPAGRNTHPPSAEAEQRRAHQPGASAAGQNLDTSGADPGRLGAHAPGAGAARADAQGIIRSARRRLVGLAVVAIVLPGLGATGWGLSVGEFLVTTVPGAGLLRDTQKFVALAMPAYALCAAAGCLAVAQWISAARARSFADSTEGGERAEGVSEGADSVGQAAALDRSAVPGNAGEDGKAGRRRSGGVAALFIVLLLIALPDSAWGVGGALRPVHYPAGWERVAALVDAPGTGDVAVLPGGMFRKFSYSGAAPVLDPAPRMLPRDVLQTGELPVKGATVSGEGGRAREVERVLLRGGSAAELARLGVGWVLVEGGTPGPMGESKDTLAQLTSVYADRDLQLYRARGDYFAAEGFPGARVISGAAHLLWAGLLVTGILAAAAGRMLVRRAGAGSVFGEAEPESDGDQDGAHHGDHRNDPHD
ncbi:hypothetical protein Ntsu_75710 [Nocardia sp. IFM 10818]